MELVLSAIYRNESARLKLQIAPTYQRSVTSYNYYDIVFIAQL
jgi:hypothetical protein